MKLVRDVLGLAAIFLLGFGYLGSQWFYFNGDPARWAFSMDQTSIRILASVILVGAIALAFIPEKEDK
jgi:hypothetical protein